MEFAWPAELVGSVRTLFQRTCPFQVHRDLCVRWEVTIDTPDKPVEHSLFVFKPICILMTDG